MSSVNTNLIERFHGTVKQRTKIMRDLKNVETARTILDGYMNHYNFFMEHDYLDTTPAIAGGIGEGVKNWGCLIESALKTPIKNPEPILEREEILIVR